MVKRAPKADEGTRTRPARPADGADTRPARAAGKPSGRAAKRKRPSRRGGATTQRATASVYATGGEKRRVLIGIAGGTASGKTMVADQVCEMLGSDKVAIIKQDSYYNDLSDRPFEERVKENFDHPDAFDRKLLYNHVRLLLEGSPVNVPIYDFKRHVRLEDTERISGCRIIILEGILLLDDPLLRELMDIKVYIDTDSDIRLMRRIERDVTERGRTLASVLDQYENSVRPMHLQFVQDRKSVV